jgi:cell division protein FtsZ
VEHIIKTAVKSIAQDAKVARFAPTEKDKDLEAVLGEHRTRIRVVGCGGGGNNTITRLMEVGIAGVETLAVNTDAQDLLYAKANDKILIGRTITNGLGAGSDPKIGEDSALENQKDLEEALHKTDMVFVTCGLGGGTGTGSAPVVAEVAKKLGALTISIVTLPFTEEGTMRWDNARLGLDKLSKNSDTVIVVQNDRLLEIVPDMPLDQAFKVADEILVNAVKGITELVTEKGLVNLDFADVRSVMRNGGTAMIGLGESEGADHAKHAVEMAIQNPLLDVDIIGAKSALINITGGTEMSLKDAKVVMKTIAEKLDPSARVIWGARVDKNLKSAIRVMLIVTGLRRRGEEVALPDKLFSKPAPPREILGSRDRTRSHSPRDAALLHDKEIKQTALDPTINSKGVFGKIFLEEAQPDLDMLRRSITDLTDDPSNKESLRGIKNATLAINNSAQLFAFNQIADFAAVVEETSRRALGGEIEMDSAVARLFEEVPHIIDGMLADDRNSFADAELLTEKLRILFGRQDDANNEQQARKAEKQWMGSRPDTPQPPSSQAIDFDHPASTSANDGAKISRVSDAVFYVKHLFTGETEKKR